MLEEHYLDVRDLDTSWFEGVKLYLDRDLDLYYLPEESADRLGEYETDDDRYYLLDGSVIAERDELQVDGQVMKVWSVGVTQLRTRPSRRKLG